MVFFGFRLVFCKNMILSGWVSIFVHAVTLTSYFGTLIGINLGFALHFGKIQCFVVNM